MPSPALSSAQPSRENHDGERVQSKVVAILIARMDSTRLPGKAMMEIAGMPLIALVHRRVSQAAQVHSIALATSDRACDDALANWAAQAEIAVHRGSVDDVATRVADCAAAQGATHFIRINGDSPFADAGLIDAGVQLAFDSDADLVTNLMPRSYPYGVAVEVLKLKTYREALPHFTPEEREHVTQHLYRNPERYQIQALPPATTLGLTTVRLTIDEPSDVGIIAALAQRLGQRLLLAGYEEVSRLTEAVPSQSPA